MNPPAARLQLLSFYFPAAEDAQVSESKVSRNPLELSAERIAYYITYVKSDLHGNIYII